MPKRKATRHASEEEEEEATIATTDLPESRVTRRPKKKSRKNPKRKRETLYRTKIRRKLLREYHILIRKRKELRKKILANRRHRNQLIFHRS